jgi:hypothetical protein
MRVGFLTLRGQSMTMRECPMRSNLHINRVVRESNEFTKRVELDTLLLLV